jgi:Mrp family chromosome partitioning ATPase
MNYLTAGSAKGTFQHMEHNLQHGPQIIAFLSGKGGTGKSTVTALAAAACQRKGFQVGILDGDISFPSMTTIFGLSHGYTQSSTGAIEPSTSSTGIKIIGMDMFSHDIEQPLLWRAPLLASAFRQLYSEVQWGELDYLFIDLPSGTGDIPIYALQLLEITGAVIVSTPQLLSTSFVKRSVKMAHQYHCPIFGVVENMAYFNAADREYYELYGPSTASELVELAHAPLLARLPFDQTLAQACNSGQIEVYSSEITDALAAHLLNTIETTL